jgi:ADP-heptose:LPS heptosyltransferase
VAAAVGVPVLAIIGPENERRTRPWGEGNRVITAGVECRPCASKAAYAGCREMRCLLDVTPDEVLAMLAGMMAETREPGRPAARE